MIPFSQAREVPSALWCHFALTLQAHCRIGHLTPHSFCLHLDFSFGSILLLSNRHITELIPWFYSPLPAFRWLFPSVTFSAPHIFKHWYEHKWTQRTSSPGAAISVWWGHRKAKLGLIKSGRSSSGMNKNQLMAGSETYLWGTDRFVLSGFFSCLLRERTKKKTKIEPHMSQENIWFLHSYTLASWLHSFLHRKGNKLQKIVWG